MKQSVVGLRGRGLTLSVGAGLPLRYSLAVGVNAPPQLERTLELLQKEILERSFAPDVLVDLSLNVGTARLYESLCARHPGPVGALPHYYTAEGQSIDRVFLLEEISRCLEAGVSHLTLHLTADRDLWEVAKDSRQLPTTSRGGSIVLQDLLSRGRRENLYRSLLPDIVGLVRRYRAVVSLGSTFRPSSIFEFLDTVHVAELKRQLEIRRELVSNGVEVLMEGLNHAPLQSVSQFFVLLNEGGDAPPVMALGPTPIEDAGRMDPIAAAMAVSAASRFDSFAIFQCVTEVEHLGGVPSIQSARSACEIAHLAASAVNVARGSDWRSRRIAEHRASIRSCVTPSVASNGGRAGRRDIDPGCSRCDSKCPLLLGSQVESGPIVETLLDVLPEEVFPSVLKAFRLTDSLGAPTRVLFGSAAKNAFALARRNGRLLLLSDVEFVSVFDEAPDRQLVHDVERAIAHTLSSLIAEQPFFHLDWRAYTYRNLLSADRAWALHRELYCFGRLEGREVLESVCAETDLIPFRLADAHLRSAVEWYLLHAPAILGGQQQENAFLKKCLSAIFLRKLQPLLCCVAGVPFTASALDLVRVRAVPASADLRALFDQVVLADAARADRSGALIERLSIPGDLLSDAVRLLIRELRLDPWCNARPSGEALALFFGLMDRESELIGTLPMIRSYFNRVCSQFKNDSPLYLQQIDIRLGHLNAPSAAASDSRY